MENKYLTMPVTNIYIEILVKILWQQQDSKYFLDNKAILDQL